MTKKKNPFGDIAINDAEHAEHADVDKAVEKLKQDEDLDKALEALSMAYEALQTATEAVNKYLELMPKFLPLLKQATTIQFPEDIGERIVKAGQHLSDSFMKNVEAKVTTLADKVNKSETRVSMPGYLFVTLILIAFFLCLFTGLALGRYRALFPIFWKGIAATLSLAAIVISYHQYNSRHS